MKKLIYTISFLLLTTFAFAKVYEGVVNKVMKTDSSGLVGWRDDETSAGGNNWTIAGSSGSDLIGDTAEIWTVTGGVASGHSTAESGNTLTINQTKADGSTNGYLWSTDWNTFNNKIGAEVDPAVDTEAEIEAITGALFGASKVVTGGYVWVADGTDFESVPVSGDCTMASGGGITCDHDALDNFVAAEHIDWAGVAAGTIHTDNYIEDEDLGVDEVYAVGWNTDSNSPEKDDVYDYLHAIDTNDDGDVDNIDATLWATKAAALGADDNYVTDAEKVVIGNTSGTNTGDNTVATSGDSATSFFSTGTLEVGIGGTGASTFTDAGVLIGNVTGAIQVTTAGTSGQVLTSNGAGVDPTFQSAAGGNDARLILDALTTGEQFDVTASTTLVEITNLSQTLAAGTYTFQYNIIYRSNQATCGIRYAVNFNGNNGAFVWNWRWADLAATASTAVPDQDDVDAAGNVVGTFQSRAESTTTRGTTLSVDTINADMMVIIEGVFVATGAGDLELWTASEVNTAGYTTSTMIGTSVIIHKTK